MAPAAPDTAPYPLYNTTFTLHRLSPLHHLSALTPASLRTHASQLRDLLAGDVLRGVRVGLSSTSTSDPDSALARVGSLRAVLCTPLGTPDEWAAAAARSPDREDDDIARGGRGILVEVVYEKASYSAILLRDGGAAEKEEAPGFTSYPLLLTRMPAALRATLVGFLAATFDARAAPLRIPSARLVRALETFLGDIAAGDEGAMLRGVARDVVLTFSFAGGVDADDAETALRGIDVTVPRDDVGPMLVRGRQLVAGEGEGEGPFMAALGRYVEAHLGLEAGREEVRVVKVACGAWVLGGEGKVKVFQPKGEEEGGKVWRGACEKLVEGLVGWAGRREVG